LLTDAEHVQLDLTRIHDLGHRGFNALVYEHSAFLAVNRRAIQIASHITVHAVAALIGKSATIAAIIFSFADFGWGLVTAWQVSADDFTLQVRYLRQGRVNNAIMLSPGRAIQGRVVIGDVGEAWTQLWDAPDFNFSNTNWIAQEAIRIWRANTGQ